MRKFLFILLFLPLIGAGQGIEFNSSSQAFVNNATLTIGSQAYSQNRTYFFFIATTAASQPPDDPTVSSGALTLTKLTTVTTSVSRIILYKCIIPSGGVTTAITFTYSAVQGRHLYAIYRTTTGFPANFTAVTTQTAGTTGANPSIVMPLTSTSYTVGYFLNNTNPFGGTAESGWTESFDAGVGGPVGHAAYYRGATTDNTIDVTAASSTWIGIGFQITQPRRIFIQ